MTQGWSGVVQLIISKMRNRKKFTKVGGKNQFTKVDENWSPNKKLSAKWEMAKNADSQKLTKIGV